MAGACYARFPPKAATPSGAYPAAARRRWMKLQTRFAYATNGQRIYQADMTTGEEDYVPAYPTPDELWNRVFAEQNAWRDRFAAIPFED